MSTEQKSSTEFPKPNFQWPLKSAGIEVPVVLEITRDKRTQQLHVQAWSFDDGYPEPWGTVSTLPHDGVRAFLAREPDHFFVKDYSENEGVFAALIEQGYIEDAAVAVRPETAFCNFPLAKLTAKGRALAPTLFPTG